MQQVFHDCVAPQRLYGGSAGGGKSKGLRMEAIRQMLSGSVKGLILRKTFPELNS